MKMIHKLSCSVWVIKRDIKFLSEESLVQHTRRKTEKLFVLILH